MGPLNKENMLRFPIVLPLHTTSHSKVKSHHDEYRGNHLRSAQPSIYPTFVFEWVLQFLSFIISQIAHFP